MMHCEWKTAMKSGLLMVSFLSFFFISSQTFERVETTVGLSILEENNGVAVADYDGDNDMDIFVVAIDKDDPSSPKTISRLFRNNNDGSFTDVTEFAGLTELLSQEEGGDDYFGLAGHKSGASWGDYNNDGFPDLFLTNSYKVQLWRNIGNGTFVNVTGISGFEGLNDCRNTGATWFDYNNDGYLDIYISDWDECESNQLFRNNGNSTFTNVTSQSNIQATNGLASYTAVPFDFNDDGFMDIYISNDFDEPNDLYINNGGSTFSNQSEAFGVNTMGDDMGITVGDYNLDGAFDIFITAIDNNFLLTNNGDNTFSENADALNIGNSLWAWGTRFADFDLDGDEDLFVANGYEFETRNVEPNFYYRNTFIEGGNSFEDISAELGLNEQTISVEAIDWDYDNDGDLDLFVTNSNTSSFFYENKILNFDDSAPAMNWLKIKLQGTISNRDAIGTVLEIVTSEGVYSRYYSGVGFLGQSLKPVHFGLNQITEIQEITVKWPSGLEETYENLDVNQTYKLTEAQGIENLNIQPSEKIYGCTDPTSCSYNPEATLDDGSCTFLETGIISGNTNSSFLSVETYSFPISSGSTAQWSVIGGHIENGQGTGSITVEWEIEEEGQVSVREFGENCAGEERRISVNLSATNLPDNISISRLWNEALLEAIRNDFARPTVHARNLFHTSIAMYDIWATYNEGAQPYLVGNTVNGFTSNLETFIPIEPIDDALNRAISYAMYHIISHRFQTAPEFELIQRRIDLIMEKLDYDTNYSSVLYEFGNAAAFGNYVAQVIINYGLQDGSRESSGYDNAYYQPVNEPYGLELTNNPPTEHPNRWRPLGLDIFIDQGGNVVDGNVPEFLSPEWGNVFGFALKDEDLTSYERDGNTYKVFHDPQDPPYISLTEANAMSDAYKWGFSMVSVWQSHLDPADGVMWDISPASKGNVDVSMYPSGYEEYPNFYNFFEGSATNVGHTLNPVTGSPYQPNMVPRGDYARVLAEFWADGPDSETPPGHWFTILNYVNDHPMFEKKFQGEGDILDDLEWDVKSYFILGATMHDAAIAAWSVKGWYDYIRPISALRYMAAEQGQSSNPELPNYSISGIPLIDGYIEMVEEGDPLAGPGNLNVGKIKLYTWRGHDYIEDTDVDVAGVGWILAEDWYPYQRPTFVTPPFAGFVSGHSTYSRAAAEILTKLTGSEYFPGGIGEFVARKNEFLVFEEGPSQDVVLQWATYRDASDQTSLSRIWGGIHPPADDIPGRFIGIEVAEDTWELALPYFSEEEVPLDPNEPIRIYPVPTQDRRLNVTNTKENAEIQIFDLRGRLIAIPRIDYDGQAKISTVHISSSTSSGPYLLVVDGETRMVVIEN